MRTRRYLAILAAALAVAGCFQAPSSKSKQTEQKGQFGVFYIVNVSRPVGGVIQSTDGQVNCGTAGSGRDACGPVQFPWTATATFNAVADAGQVFQSWAGDCGGVGSCKLDTVSSGADKYIVAVFNPPDRLGHASIPDPAQHGPLFFAFVKKTPNVPKCNTCHGPTYTGLGNAPSCTDCHAQAGFPDWLNNCNFCHTNPPAAPHVQASNCSACHTGYGDKVATGVQGTNPALHMNGTVDVSGAACTACHGTPGVNAAPPVDLSGGTATTSISVGAHQAHLTTTTAKPVACAECHVVPTDMGHVTNPPANRVVFGALAGQGVTATWSSANATCTSYCHGGSTALAGGTGTTPVWTQVNGTFSSCTSCHGAPPPLPHPQNAVCGTCHTGYTVNSTAPATHVNGVVDVRPLTCTSCHGTEGRTGSDPYVAAAPPTGASGETLATEPAVGAHQAHLTAGPLARAFACTDCHNPPTSTSHANGVTDFSFSVLAGGSAVRYDAQATTCSNVYCHGNFTGGKPANAPVWTSGAAGRACGTCHGVPPPAPHSQSMACGNCHTGYSGASVNLANHVNGVVDVVPLSCTSCHGTSGVNAAPPLDTAGGSGTAFVSVGAHQAHVTTGLMAPPIACSECHGAAAASYGMGHADGTVQVSFGATANNGTSTVWTRGTASCAASYCHGGTTAVAGGTGTTPVWTVVNGTFKGCTSCHGAPPPAPHPQNASCGSCHSGYTATSVNASLHINRAVDVSALSCTSCHGTSGVNAAPPVDTTGGTATGLVSVGAHQVHVASTLSSAIACSQCHGAAADAYTMAHADSTVQVLFGALANQGTSTTWTRGTASCAASYCHGGTAAVAGGTATTPVWTTVNGTFKACTACHGDPPALSAATHHPSNANCSACHGTGYSSSTVVAATHVNGTVNVTRTGCTTCHGDLSTTGVANTSVLAAPGASAGSADTAGNTTATSAGVGAHAAHLTGTRLRATPIDCAECHAVPAAGDVAHATGTGTGGARATVSFGTLARTGLGTTASYAGSATGAGGTTAGTCSNVYCHGSFSGSGVTSSLSWTAGPAGAAGCASCHGAPPPAPHTTSTACGSCHAGYTATSVNLATHLNGTVDVQSLSCTSCHGGVNAAPPVDTTGGSATTLVSVGAHQAHVTTTLMAQPVACSECHGAAAATYTNAHTDGTVQVAFGTLADQGTTTVWTRGTASCAASYCHGGTSAVAGGTGTTPVWTKVDGTYKACNACHGAPPPAPHAQSTACGSCHAGYTSTAVNAAVHLNGTVDVPSLSCTSCHGSVNPAPPVDTTGGSATTLVSVGAHQAHVASTLRPAIACTECHGAASATYTNAHTDGTVQVAFGSLSNQGTATVWTRGSASCAASYCHGGTTAVAGGTGTTPVWTTVDGTFKGCTSCHGDPPPAPHVQNSTCSDCHTGYTNTSVAVATHVNGVVNVKPLDCSSCHGDALRTGADPYIAAMPPTGTAGETSTSQAAVGAHEKHLSGGSLSKAMVCTDCHNPPATTSHATGTTTFSWSVLAGSGATNKPSYDPTSATCSNVYCHGNFTGGATANAPVWTAGAAATACGSCHGVPPAAPHTQSTACGSCHAGYTATTVNLANHVNGLVDVNALSCTSCHGSANPAPPVDTTGGSATTLVSVGAHQAHVASTLAGAIACSQCHGAAADSYGVSHTDGIVQVSFGALANQGTSTTWTHGTATCAASYCHGGTSAVAGGTATTPVWTTVNGTFKACTACHGDPPALSAATHHPSNANCTACHGTGYSSSTVAAATHVNGTVNVTRTGCTTCHGDLTQTGVANTSVLAAPGASAGSADTAGNTAATSAGVGAHAAHLTGTRLRATPIACSECHVVPGVGDVAHATGTGTGGARATVAFGALALTGGITTASYAGSATAASGTAAGTCSNVYCHGGFTGSGVTASLSWTGGQAAAGCGSCHGVPPPAPHVQNTACDSCHAGYTSTSVNLATHLNGTVEVNGLSCTTCHGTNGVNAAPPADTTGGTATTLVSVGAHQAHVAPTVRAAIACSECHGVASSSYTTTHSDGTVQVAFGALADQGTATVWTRGTASCAASYCHGGTSAVAGGTGTTPVWTTVDGTYRACNSCHGSPPALSATTHHPSNASCASCHGTGYTNAAVSGTALSSHVDGTVQKPANGCTACHGVLAGAGGAAVANTSATAAPGYDASAVDTAGNTAATFAGVGAHAAHLTGTRWRSTALACSECHTVPATADVAHATGVGTGGARATMTFGTLAKTGLGTTAAYAGSATAAGGSTAGTCSNVYCHGAFTGSGVTAPISWTGGAAAANCGTCHGAPPPAPHVQNTACGSCHTGYTSTSVNLTAHLNGTVDVANLSCTSCHGEAARPAGGIAGVTYDVNQASAPPVDTLGASTGVRVGTHLAHVNPAGGGVYKPVACAECHPDNAGNNAHTNSAVDVTFASATAANLGGVTPALVQGDGATTQTTCTTYCHGASLDATTTRGSVASWTWNGAAADCGSCHKSPPGTANHHNAAALTTCARCHGGTVDGAGAVLVSGNLHVNGTVDVAGLTCATCHGNATLVASGNQDPNVAAAPTGAGAPDTYGNTAVASAGVGVHAAHVLGARSRAVQCNACHVVPGTLVHKTGIVAAGTVVLGNLATTGSIGNAAYAGAGGTCSNTYCHGNFTGGTGAVATPAWTAGGTLGCGACHGNPPALSAATHHPSNANCVSCHGTGYSSSTVAQATHVDGAVTTSRTGCTLCHGDLTQTGVVATSAAAAPGFNASAADTAGNTAATFAAVGAHAAHVTGTRWRTTPIACAECHVVPGAGDVAHATGAGTGGARATTTFGTLARTGGITSASYGGSSTGAGGTAAGTCSNVYCHGNFTGSGVTSSVSWTGGAAAANCGTCHGNPPPAPHVQNSACGSCHSGYTSTTVNGTAHLNGTVDVVAMSCTTCHGTNGVNAAPPADTSGGSATTLVSVGAHQAHAASTLRTAIACTECHGTASGSYTNTHSDGTVQVSFGTLSNNGTTTVWTRGTASCAASYCHGGTSAVAGGTGTTPVWTTVDGTYKACTSCHGSPPALSASTHHPANAACASCHGTGYTNAAITGAALSTHVDGTVNKPANGCTACHGVLAGTAGAAVANTSATAAPGYNASAVDTAGNTAATFAGIGAHQAHLTGTRWRSTVIACSECHTVPAAADVVHATGTGTGGARATMTFGTLARTGLGTTASYAGSATAAGGSTAGTCSNVYCHGAFTGSGVTASVSWTGGAAAANCGTCHGNPPPAPHVQNTTCSSCHTGYTNTSVNVTAHLNGVVDVATMTCSSCHGDSARTGTDPNIAAMPPVGTAGETLTTQAAVGAHQKHLSGGSLSNAMACTDCHNPPTSTSHATGTTTFSWSVLAGSGATNKPSYDPTSATCSNVYCHGNFAGGTPANAPVWTAGAAGAACGSCHAVPPPAPHSQNTACGNCHAGYTATSVNLASHVNGLVDVVAMTCTSCHGTTGVNAAPPVATTGGSATTLVAVGAHQAHVVPTLRSAIACTECHGAASASYTTGHSDAIVQVSFGSLSNQGTTTTWTRGSASCSASYCHGGTSAVAGGVATTPVWTAVNGTYSACNACHGNPPTALGHPNNTNCSTCHGAGYNYASATTGTITGGALATHVDGSVTLVAAESCSSCHGTTGRAAGGIAGMTYDANLAAAPPADSRNLATNVMVGAHLAHVNPVASSITGGAPQPTGGIMHPIACSECHPNNTGFQHAGSTATPSVILDFTLATGANLGSWTTTVTRGNGSSTATTCSTYCHGASLGTSYKGTATNPAWDGGAASCGSCHGFPPLTSGHSGVSSLSTACAGCHSATVNVDGTINIAGGHHVDGVQDVVKGNSCSGCHSVAGNMKLATTYQHVMAQDPGAAYPVDNSTPVADADRNCNICHMKHEFPNAATNLRNTINSASPTASNTDAALCVSCHGLNSMTKDATRQKADNTTATPVVLEADFTGSAHDYAVQGSFGANNFTVNCVKCHNSTDATTHQTGANTFVLHTSPDRRLRAPLGRATLTDDDSANFCYRCHSAAADAIGGTKKSATANDWYGAVTTMPAGATNVFTQMQKGTAGSQPGSTTSATTLYFKPTGAETPAEPMPNGHLPGDTFQGGTWIGRSMSPGTTTTAYETKSQATTGVTAGTARNWQMATFTSPAVATAVNVPAGNWTINLYDREGNGNQNARVRYAIYKWNANDTAGTTIVARGTYATEMGTTALPGATQAITVAGAAVSLAVGDKIVVDLELATTATSTTSYTASYSFGSGAASNLVLPASVTFTYAGSGTPASGRHDVGAYTGKHKPNPDEEHLQYIAANKHVDCSDCHDPHRAKRGNQGDSGTVTASGGGCTNSTSVLCDTTQSWAANAWNGYYVEIYTASSGAALTGTSRVQISGNNATQLNLATALSTTPAATHGYRIAQLANAGAVTAAANTPNPTLTDGQSAIGGAKAWAPNAFAGWSVQIVYGTGTGQVRTIASNTGTVLTLSTAWTTVPDTTSRYIITKIPNVMIGAGGVNVAAWGVGSPTAWGEGKTFSPAAGSTTALPDATSQVQVCMKCHSAANTALATWKSTWTDVAQDFNPRNQSYHPVMAAAGSVAATGYGNTQITQAMVNGWRAGDTMTCSDCHGNDSQVAGASHGPHASAVAFILKGPNPYWPFQSDGTTRWNTSNTGTGLFCFNCHGGLSGVHTRGEHGNTACTSCHIRIPHGGKVKRLIRTTGTPAPYADTGTPALLNSYSGGSGQSGSCGSLTSGCTNHTQTSTSTNSW